MQSLVNMADLQENEETDEGKGNLSP
jgi:hypothetical protein